MTKYLKHLFPIDIPHVKKKATQLAAEIRSVLEPVLIRRNRLDLRNDPVYSKEVTELSEVADPSNYSLNYRMSK